MQIISSAVYYIRSVFSLINGFYTPFHIFRIFLGLNRKYPGGKQIQLRKTRTIFNVRDAMDVWSIKETFIDDFYHFENSNKPDSGVIIDIGAGIGEFTIQAAKACPDCKVYGFEPFPESFEFLEKNAHLNSLTNIYPIPAAVSSIQGTLILDTSSGNPLQFRMQNGNSSDTPIQTVLLMNFLKEHSINKVEIIKLDCEGGEFDILLPLSNEDISCFKRIVMEYHDSLTPHNHTELVQHLITAGFMVDVIPNVVHDDIGYIYAQFGEN